MPTDWDERYSAYGKRAVASEIRELLKLLDRPNLISFAGGIPDPSLFPRELIAESHARILGRPETAAPALQYSVSEGYLPLRQWLAGHMRAKGVACRPENILITNGSQQALYLAGRLFLDGGDRVLTARPAYLGALQAFSANACEFLPLSAIELADMPKAKLAYAMPDFANPTGETMTIEERRTLTENAQARDVVIVEDAAYSDLRYDGEPLPPLLAFDVERTGSIEGVRTIYCGTFSKTVIPGLRVGWMVAPASVINKAVLLKQANDLHASSLTQMALTEVVQRLPQSHVAMLCEVYSARRDAMLKALAAHMPHGVDWTKPAGGMFIWLRLPEGVDAASLLRAAIDEGVAFVPGATFYTGERQHNSARLCFTLCEPKQIEEGIAKLGALIARVRTA